MRVDIEGKVSRGGLGVVFPGGYISVAGDWPGLSGQCQEKGLVRQAVECRGVSHGTINSPTSTHHPRLPLWLAQPPELSLCLPCLPACHFTQPSVALTEVMRDRPDAIALLWFLVS